MNRGALALFALSAASCRRSSQPVVPTPVTVDSGARRSLTDAALSLAALDVALSPSSERTGELRCTPSGPDGPDLLLPALRVRSLALAARSEHALLTVHVTDHIAHEGMPEAIGDDNDRYGSVWWSSEVALGDGGAAAWRRDNLAPPDLGREVQEFYGRGNWIRLWQLPARADNAWSRWTFGAAWGNTACSPSGGTRARVGARTLAEQTSTLLPTELRVATDGEVSMAVGMFTTQAEGCGPESTQVDVFRASARGLAETSLVPPTSAEVANEDDETAPPRTPVALPEVLALALEARGAAVLLRYEGRELRLALVGRNGVVQQRPRRVYRGSFGGARTLSVGTPTMAFFRGELVIVWGERATPAGRFRLRLARMDPWAPNAALSPSDLGPAVPMQQLAPSLVARGDALALSWTEGGLRGPATVKLALGRSIDELLHSPGEALSEGVASEARASVLAIDGERLWVAWEEPARGKSAIRVRLLRCP